MPPVQTDYRDSGARTTFEPFAAVKAVYADSSYYEADMQRDRGTVSLGKVEDAYRTTYNYVNDKLVHWSKSTTPTAPISYKIYLSFNAKYKDGRKAERSAGWNDFKTVDEAVAFVESKAKTLLAELAGIGKDDI